MATFQKRGTTWRASVARHGQRVTSTHDSRAAAERWAVETEARILAGEALAAEPPTPATTVADLFDRYAREVSPAKGGARWEITRLRTWPNTFPLFAGPVAGLTSPALAAWRDMRLQTVLGSTVNRELNLVSAVCNRAVKEWRTPGISMNPCHLIQRPTNPPPRTRMVTPGEYDALLARLGWGGEVAPVGAEQWIAWTFTLAMETAMRRGEVLAITWQHVDLAALKVHLPRTKNGYPRDVPLSSAALRLFSMLPPGEPGAAVVPVLHTTFDTMFRRARDAAGITDLHFHDTRRAGATALAAKLGDVLELAAVTGHRSLNILRQRYYQPDATAIARKLG